MAWAWTPRPILMEATPSGFFCIGWSFLFEHVWTNLYEFALYDYNLHHGSIHAYIIIQHDTTWFKWYMKVADIHRERQQVSGFRSKMLCYVLCEIGSSSTILRKTIVAYTVSMVSGSVWMILDDEANWRLRFKQGESMILILNSYHHLPLFSKTLDSLAYTISSNQVFKLLRGMSFLLAQHVCLQWMGSKTRRFVGPKAMTPCFSWPWWPWLVPSTMTTARCWPRNGPGGPSGSNWRKAAAHPCSCWGKWQMRDLNLDPTIGQWSRNCLEYGGKTGQF